MTKVSQRFALDPFAIVDVVQMLRHGEIDRALAYAKSKMQIIGPLEYVEDSGSEASTGDGDRSGEPIITLGMNPTKF